MPLLERTCSSAGRRFDSILRSQQDCCIDSTAAAPKRNFGWRTVVKGTENARSSGYFKADDRNVLGDPEALLEQWLRAADCTRSLIVWTAVASLLSLIICRAALLPSQCSDQPENQLFISIHVCLAQGPTIPFERSWLQGAPTGPDKRRCVCVPA